MSRHGSTSTRGEDFDESPCKLVQCLPARRHTAWRVTISGSIQKKHSAKNKKLKHMIPYCLSYNDLDNPSTTVKLRWLSFRQPSDPMTLPTSINHDRKAILDQNLQELSTLVVPVNNLHTKPLQWCSTVDVLSWDSVVKYLQIAFDQNMSKTEGKIAFQKLFQEIISIIDLEHMDVLSLDSDSGKGRFRGIVNFQCEFSEPSANKSTVDTDEFVVVEEPEVEKSNNSASVIEKQSLVNTHSDKITQQKLISDIMICENLTFSEPPFVLMAVAIKSGFDLGTLTGLCTEMASYIAPQKQIYGLQVCSNSAKLVHMHKNLESERLYIEEFACFDFFLPNESDKFHVANFKQMIDDVICVLHEANKSRATV